MSSMCKTFQEKMWNWAKGSGELSELCGNTEANHICTRFFSLFFSPATYFHFDANKKKCFCFWEFPTFTQTQETKTSIPLPLIYIRCNYVNTCQIKWSWPFSLTNYNRERQIQSLETKFICLYSNKNVLKLCAYW